MVVHSHPMEKAPQRRSRIVSHSPVFYGWVVWVVASLAIIAAAPGLGFTMSLFMDHYIEDFGLSRTEISTMLGIGTFVAGLTLAWLGKKIDRYGNRAVGTAIAVVFSLVLVSLSLTTGAFTLFLGFLTSRFLALGIFLVGGTAIAQWWRLRRGWVIGLAMVASALFRWRYLPALQSLIEHVGWRTTWVILGVAVGSILLPLWLLFMRDRPEDYGLEPDGEKPKIVEGEYLKTASPIIEYNWTLPQVRRTAIFWVLASARTVMGFFGAGLVVHQASVFAQVGHSEAVMAEIFGWASLISVASTFVVGWLINHIRPGLILAIQLVFMICTLQLITVMTEIWMLTIFAIFFGAVWGFGGTFDGTVWANLFGRQHHGAIRGFVTTIHVFGTSAGPIFYGFCYDYFGDYQPVTIAGSILLSVGIILCLRVKLPPKTPESAPNPP